MSFCKRNDPGSVNRWKSSVAKGVATSHRQCPACARRSNGGRTLLVEERMSVWRCRYCGHEMARSFDAGSPAVVA